MGESGFFFPEIPRFAGAGIDAHSCKSYLPAAPPRRVPSFTAGLRFSGQKLPSDVGCRSISSSSRPRRAFGFADDEYYRGFPKKNEKSPAAMTTKKKLKLLRGLLSEFGEVEEMIVSEAAQVLIKQLQQVRVKEKEMKRNKKLEKAKTKSTSSSSSSSSSSDSDCENKKVRQFRNKPHAHPPIVEELQSASAAATLSVNMTEEKVGDGHKSPASSNIRHVDKSSSITKMNHVEVCMGKKCKLSGSAALLDEFEKVFGNEGAVVGSMCMGKCRYGPNVRVPNSSNKTILIGVDLEDVSVIAASLN